MKKWRSLVVGLISLALLVVAAGFWIRSRADLQIGERLAKNNCNVCHDLTRAKKNEKGPYLWGIVNRPAGSVDFPYSGPFLNHIHANPVVWSEDNLERFLANPGLFIPQIRMAQHTVEHPFAFDGMDSAANRRDLVAWLKTLR
ncbi:MAG: cytochrome c family protein [Magnetococcales bacterium]|nr:cytochrome c family protein [Magnetococcales bacterium]MBF0420350.1 cytochrome c family protein [Magnetococcales bacterium]